MKTSLHVIVILALLSGCVPAHLNKYRKDPDRLSVAPNPTEVSTSAIPSAPPALLVEELGSETYRFPAAERDVWEGALAVLLQNYNFRVVSRSEGIVSTEWDTFYAQGAVFRNMVTIKVTRVGGATQLTLRNNIERLRDGGSVWLPADDGGKEVARIVVNVAKTLGNEPPKSLVENLSILGTERQESAL